MKVFFVSSDPPHAEADPAPPGAGGPTKSGLEGSPEYVQVHGFSAGESVAALFASRRACPGSACQFASPNSAAVLSAALLYIVPPSVTPRSDA